MTELKIKTLSMQLAEQEEQLAAYKAALADQAATIEALKKQLALQ